MALKTSLVITGDSSSATAALKATEKGAQQMADAMARADQEIDRLAKAQATANRELAEAKAQFKAGELSVEAYNKQVLETRSALSLFESQHRSAVNALKQSQSALQSVGPSAGQAQAGYVNLGRQMQDVAVQMQGGANLGTIISQQGGQIADAVAMMGGRFSGLASFLAGPWGAAIIVGTGVLTNLISEMFKSGDAAEKNAKALHKVELASSGTKDAQTVLGEIFDLTTGKIKSQNAMLLLNAQLQALNLQAEAQAERARAKETKGSVGRPGWTDFGPTRITSPSVRRYMDDVEAGRLSPVQAVRKAGSMNFSGSGITREQAIDWVRDTMSAPVKEAIAKKIESSIDTGVLDKSLRESNKKKEPKPKDYTTSAAKMEDSVEQSIAKMANKYADLPTEIQKVNADLLDLTHMQDEVEKRAKQKGGKVIDLPKVLADIQAVRDAIKERMNKPFEDYLKNAAEARSIDKLAVAGREDEAAALKVVLGLQEKQGPLSAEQTAAVLQTVKAQREMGLVLRDQRALVQANVQAVQSMRSALTDTVANALKGRMSAQSILSSLGNSYVNIMSQRITESLFGNALRDLEAQAGDGFKTAMGRGADSVTTFADAVLAATAKINGAPVTGGAASSVAKTATGRAIQAAVARAASNDNASQPDEIVVAGQKPKTDVSGGGGRVTSLFGTALRGLGINLGQGLQDKLVPIFGRLEKKLPDALQGAFAGNVASKLIVGSGSSSVGSSIGGAIGKKMGEKFLGAGMDMISKGLGSFAGPLGSILGGVVGGMLGDLFTTSKRGTTVITSTSKDAATTASTSDVQAGLSNLSTSIQSSLDAIASKFSTTVGDFAVSIGQYKDYYRVSASGSSHVGDKYYPNSAGSDILYDGTDTAAAVMIAIQNAIKDGAIRGLSDAVQKALASSSNIERAVAEALKVQEVELLIGGLGATMEKSFKDLDAKAAERVRIAKDYGFDLLTVEKANADKRLALQKSLLKEQVGSLQDLITEMTSGSLFEGSLVDQRNAILAQITAAKADVAAGKDGAGDALAKLLEQLNTVSRDAYGTTGNFATDRTLISDTARDAIASANAAIQAAADAAAASMASATATDATTTQLDEANDQLAKIAATLGISLDYLKAIAANGNSVSDLAKAAGY